MKIWIVPEIKCKCGKTFRSIQELQKHLLDTKVSFQLWKAGDELDRARELWAEAHAIAD